MAGRPTRYEVLLTRGAEQDLESIYDYISEFDSVANGESHTWRATREFALLGEILGSFEWGTLDMLMFDLPMRGPVAAVRILLIGRSRASAAREPMSRGAGDPAGRRSGGGTMPDP